MFGCELFGLKGYSSYSKSLLGLKELIAFLAIHFDELES